MLMLCGSALFGQGILRIPPKFFTLRNARVTPGLYFSFHTDNTPDPESNVFKSSTGTLPPNYDFDFGAGDTLHYGTAGLLLDIGSPNSVLGFALGVEYNLNKFGIRESTTDTLNSFRVHSLRFPAYLKIKIGAIHNRINGILMGGVQYAFPISYQRRLADGREVGKTNEVESGLYLSTILGLQYRTSSGSDKERTRFWLFARADLATGNQFSPVGNEAVFGPNNRRGFSYRDLNISFGAAFFLGAGG